MVNDRYIYENLETHDWLLDLSINFFVTIMMPLFFAWILLKLKMITSLIQPNIQDRKLLILYTELSFVLIYYVYHNTQVTGGSLALYFLGVNAAMVLALIISLFTRISLHALGVGGILGTVIGLIYYTRFEMMPWVCGAMFLALLVGYSRYKLKAHEPGDIYIGYIIGMVAQSLVFFIGGR